MSLRSFPHVLRLGALLALASCTGPEPTDSSTKDTDTITDTDTDTITDTDTDTGTTTDTSTDTTSSVVRDPRFDAVVEVLEAELAANLAEGVSIAVMEQGSFVWVEGFGTADPGADVPMRPDHILQIGSTTKQMTAALVLGQEEAGLLSLDDTVAEALPQFSLALDPGWRDDATLHALLSHQGGLFDYLDWAGPESDTALATWHYGFFADNLWPMNPPGLFWNYSNPNFTLAGLATEVHDPASRAWPDQAEQDLFAPLGMTSTFARKASVEATGRYALSTGVDVSSPVGAIAEIPMSEVPDPGSVRPAGLVWSTPSDMCLWGSFLLHGDESVLGAAARAEITTPQVPLGYYGDHAAYGYGEFVWDLYPLSDGFYPIRVWEHGGNTLSFTSVLVMLPDEDVVFSILSTGYGDLWTGTTEAILRAVIDPWPEPSDYTGEPFDPAEIGGHPGSYQDVHNVGAIEITPGGSYGLQISMPLLDVYGYTVAPDLIPESTDLWYVEIDGIPYDLTFIRDPESGESTYVRNRAFVGTRVPAPVRLPDAQPTREQVAATLRAMRAPSPLRLPPPRP